MADDTDFFGAGAGSMDVVRLIEEVSSFFYITISVFDYIYNQIKLTIR